MINRLNHMLGDPPMVQRFEKPPLVELIAELRWGPSQTGPISPAVPAAVFAMGATGQHEEFFMRFGAKAAADGYSRAERIYPPGFPVPQYQTVYRFRKNAPADGTTIYQLGVGVFSANITPPYDRWDSFRPVVERGVELLLESRGEAEHASPFVGVTLRYIDAFGNHFTEGRSVAAFLREVLGFVIDLPEALKNEMADGAEAKPVLQLALPLKTGQQMGITLAEGLANNVQAIILDMSVAATKPVIPTKDEVMASFGLAHDIMHRVFVEISRKLYHIMKPIEGAVG